MAARKQVLANFARCEGRWQEPKEAVEEYLIAMASWQSVAERPHSASPQYHLFHGYMILPGSVYAPGMPGIRSSMAVSKHPCYERQCNTTSSDRGLPLVSHGDDRARASEFSSTHVAGGGAARVSLALSASLAILQARRRIWL
jgi:hypothetical protein